MLWFCNHDLNTALYFNTVYKTHNTCSTEMTQVELPLDCEFGEYILIPHPLRVMGVVLLSHLGKLDRGITGPRRISIMVFLWPVKISLCIVGSNDVEASIAFWFGTIRVTWDRPLSVQQRMAKSTVIYNYIIIKTWNVMTHPCPNFNSGSA